MKWGAFLSYFSIVFNIVAGLIYTPWMIDKIGASDYGLYTLSGSVMTLFLFDFGLSTAVTRYVSKYRAEKKQEMVNNFLGLVYKLYIAIDILILLALAIFYVYMNDVYVNLTADELDTFKTIYIITALFAVINFPFVTLNGILISYERFIEMKSADVFGRILHLVASVLVLSYGYGVIALVNVHAGVGILVLLNKLFVLRKATPARVNWRFNDKGLFRALARFSMWITVSRLAQRLVLIITPSILAIVADAAAISVFGIVALIEGNMFLVSTALGSMFIPRISKICAGEDKQAKLNALILKIGKFQHSLNGLMVAVFLVTGYEFITLWVGSDYAAAYICTALVITPSLFYNSLQIANVTLAVENKVNVQAMVNVIMGVVNVSLSFVLSSYMGVVGASLSICIAYFLRAFILLAVYKRLLGLEVIQFSKVCYGRFSLPIVSSIAGGCLINHCIPEIGWYEFIIKSSLVCLIYGFVLCFGCCTRNERKSILDYVKF